MLPPPVVCAKTPGKEHAASHKCSLFCAPHGATTAYVTCKKNSLCQVLFLLRPSLRHIFSSSGSGAEDRAHFSPSSPGPGLSLPQIDPILPVYRIGMVLFFETVGAWAVRKGSGQFVPGGTFANLVRPLLKLARAQCAQRNKTRRVAV